MPGAREYVSLPARSRQASRARADMRERLIRGRRSRTVTVTDEQLLAYLEPTVTMPTYTRGDWVPVSAEWIYDIGRVFNTTTTAATTIGTAMSRFIPAGTITTTMGNYANYDPSTYTWTGYASSTADEAYWAGWNNVYTETAEAQAAREQREAEREARMREHRERVLAQAAEMEQAEVTARQLLMAHLDAQQKRDALEHGWFEVLSDKGRRWRIRLSGYSGNVDLMPEEGEERLASYCAHGRDEMPRSDHHLAQKLVLETDDEDFIDVANVHYRSGRTDVQLPRRRGLQPARWAV